MEINCLKYSSYLLAAVFSLQTSLVQAEEASDIDIVSGVSIVQKTLDLKIRDRSFSPTFNTLNLAVTGASGHFYLTLDHEFSIKDPIETDPNGLIFYSRTETNLTLGYALLDWLNVFGGIRTGDTEAKYSFNNQAFGNSSEGIYIGTNASHYFKDKGSVGLSFAIASLEGQIALAEPFVDTSVFLVGPTPPSHIEGSALGFSFGVSWTGQYDENSLYNIGYKLQRYEFEDDVVFGGLDLTFEENFNAFSIGLTHFF